MATGIPDYYLGGTPESTQGLSPLQLALANILRTGTETALFANPDFILEMQRFTNSIPLTPFDVSENYGEMTTWDGENGQYLTADKGTAKILNEIARGITGIRVIVIGDVIYVQRVAQDCGPNEEVRYELVQVGKKSEIAEGTFAVYGKVIYSGSVSSAVMENIMALSGGV